MNKNLTLHSAALLAVFASAAVFAQVPGEAPAPADVAPPAPSAGAAPAPADSLPAASTAPTPVAEDPAGRPGAGSPPPPALKLPPVPTPPRLPNVPPPPAPGGLLRATPSIPGMPAESLPPLAEAHDHGPVRLHKAAESTPGKKSEYYVQKLAGPDKNPLTLVTKEKPAPRGEDIIRDTKLKVYQRHYETVLNEAIQARLTLLDAPPEKQDALKARQAALEEIAQKLETDIRELSGPQRVSARIESGSGTVIVGESVDGHVIREVHAGPGGGGVVELQDSEGNTVRFSETLQKR